MGWTEDRGGRLRGKQWGISTYPTRSDTSTNRAIGEAGVQVVLQTTAAASDYGLLDEKKTMAPRAETTGADGMAAADGNQALLESGCNRCGAHVSGLGQRGKPGGVSLLAQARPHCATPISLPQLRQRSTQLDCGNLGPVNCTSERPCAGTLA